MPRAAPLVALLFVVSLLVLSSVPGAPAGVSPTRGSSRSPAFLTDAIPLPPGLAGHALPGSTPVRLSLTLTSPNPRGLAAFVDSAAAPGFDRSGYLNESTFESRYAPSAVAANQVEEYLVQRGGSELTVTPDRFGVSAVLPAGQVESAFHVSLVAYGASRGHVLYTSIGTPQIPPELAGVLQGASGLSNWANPWLATMTQVASSGPAPHPGAFVVDNTTGIPLYIGSDFTQAFGVSTLFPPSSSEPNATYPTGEAIATILMSGFNNSTQADTPGFDPVAVDAYFNDTFPSAWPHPAVLGVPVTVAGRTAPPPGGQGALDDSSLDESENALDIEMAGSLAPGATVVNFYFPASLYLATSANPTIGDVADYFAATLSSALSYNYGGARLTAVTNSFGLPDLNDSLWNAELLHAAALGVTVMAASGDQGDAPNQLSGRFQGQWPTWPGTAAFESSATVAVGGLSLQLGGNPAGWSNGTIVNATFDPAVSGVASAIAWYESSGGAGTLSGSEGGVSPVIPEPTWQFHSAAQPTIANVSGHQGVSALGRAEPDLAFPGNSTIAYTAHDSSGVYYEALEGTSIASPILAGFLASCAAVMGHPFGVLDPELYRIASYYAANPSSADPFVDVSTGANYEFSAGPGWDATTGWGFLMAPAFVVADATPAVSGYVYTGPTPGLPVPPPSRPFPTYSTPTLTLVILGIAVAFAVAVAILVGRPRPPRHVPPAYYGPTPPSAPSYPGAPTASPYAWAPPPASPVSPNAPGVPPGAYGAPPVPPSAMFHCPYCGSLRPAEPVRCPGCGAF